jgi:hypothetical protein
VVAVAEDGWDHDHDHDPIQVSVHVVQLGLDAADVGVVEVGEDVQGLCQVARAAAGAAAARWVSRAG